MRCSVRLLCAAALALGMLTPGLARWDDDQRVQEVEDHFHFGVSHDRLKTVLLKSNHGGRFLDQGVILAHQMDQWDKYQQGIYYDWLPDFIELLQVKLPAETDLTALLELYLPDSLVATLGFVGFAGQFGGLGEVWNVMGAWDTEVVNAAARYYVENAKDPDDDEDVWDQIASQWPTSDPELFHAFLRDSFERRARASATLEVEVERFRADITALLAGAARIVVDTDAYQIAAPMSFTLDATDSTGTEGAAVVAWEWSVDGQVVSSEAVVSLDVLSPGPVTVQLRVTDEVGAEFTAGRTIRVSPPPVTVEGVDREGLRATFSTHTSALIANYTWDFGDGTPPVSGADLHEVTHQFPALGQYSVTLVVTPVAGSELTVVRHFSFDPMPTDVVGVVESSQVWGPEGSPYRLRGVVSIPPGVRVTLLPGAVVQGWSNGPYPGRLVVDGELVSHGRFGSSQRVHFTSYRDESAPTLGGSDEGQTGDWQGLQFSVGAFETLTGSVVRYGATGVGGSPAVVSGVRFERNGVGVSIQNRVSPVLVDCEFYGSTSYAAYLQSCTGRLSFRGLSGTGNKTNGLFLHTATVSQDSVWHSNPDFAYVIGYSCYIGSGARLSVGPGAVVKIERSGTGDTYSLQVEGFLIASGTDSSPVYFTSLKDDSVAGDTNGDGSASAPARGDWNRIVVNAAGASAVLDHCVVRYGGRSGSGATGSVAGYIGTSLVLRDTVVENGDSIGVYASQGSLLMSRSTVQRVRGSGVLIADAVADINACIIRENEGTGLDLIIPSSLIVVNNTVFESNSDHAVLVDGFAPGLAFPGCTFSGNRTNGVYVKGFQASADSLWQGHSGFAYLIEGAAINKGATLTLGAGTIVKMISTTTGAFINVKGSLVAQGTPQEPVYLTSYRDDSLGGDTNGDGAGTAPAPGDWGAIRTNEPLARVLLEHCVLRYGGKTDGVFPSPILEAGVSSEIVLDNTTIERSAGYGVRVDRGSLIMTASVVRDNPRTGLEVSQSLLDMRDCEVRGNGKLQDSGVLASKCLVRLSNCVVQDNGGYGVRLTNPSWMPELTGLSFTSNRNLALSIESYVGPLDIRSDGFTFSGNKVNGVSLSSCTLTGESVWEGHPDVAYVVGWENSIASGARLTIGAGTVVKMGGRSTTDSSSLQVKGALVVRGSADRPVWFTSLKDDSVGGDTNGDGNASAAAPGDWNRIVLSAPGATAVLEHCVVRYGGYWAPLPGSLAGLENTTIALRDSVVERSYLDGVYVLKGSLEMIGCTVRENGRNGVVLLSTSSPPTVANTAFVANADDPVIISDYSGPLTFPGPGCTFSGSRNGVFISGCTLSGDSVWEGHQGFAYVLGWYCSVAEGGTLTLEPGTVVKVAGRSNSDLPSLQVKGSLVARGAPGSPVFFTSLKDDSVSGDTNGDGGASAPAPGDWNRIVLNAEGATAVLQHCVVRYGGYYDKGSIAGYQVASVTLRNSVVERSLRSGVYIDQGSATTVTDSVFWQNTGTALEIALCSDALISNVSLAKNQQAIATYSSTVTVANTIAAYNTSGILRSGGTLNLVNNCVYGNTNYNYSGVSPGSSDISVDPKFWNLALGDLHLKDGSPCVDAGDDSFVQPGQTDIDGQLRIYGPRVDIGADEWAPGYVGPAGPPVEADKNVKIRIRGRVVFRDYLGVMPTSVLLELRNPGSTDAFASETVALSPTGAFTLAAPSRPFDLSLKHSHWLRRTLPIVLGGDPNAEVVFALINGDVNADNRVDLEDLSRILIAFTQQGPRDEDLNGDGVVGLPDLSIALRNFARVGDT
ncbi:MAG: hypothetical protein AMXMBFR61_14570 [Fimbriimonadales bacterium]